MFNLNRVLNFQGSTKDLYNGSRSYSGMTSEQLAVDSLESSDLPSFRESLHTERDIRAPQSRSVFGLRVGVRGSGWLQPLLELKRGASGKSSSKNNKPEAAKLDPAGTTTALPNTSNKIGPNAPGLQRQARYMLGDGTAVENNKPHLLAVAFHPMIDGQGSGFRAGELLVSVNQAVTSRQMYEDLVQDCRLGRVYVQLSTALAYYTLFYWNDVEYHRFLPLAVSCKLKHTTQTWPRASETDNTAQNMRI